MTEMKRTTIILIILIAGFQALSGQDLSEKLVAFRSGLFPQYNSYFISADLTPAGQLKLNATANYNQTSKAGRKAIMDNLIKSWQESLVVVQYETQKELWGWNNEKSESFMVDSWDLDAKAVQAPSDNLPSKTSLHPWFLYFGNNIRYDSNKNLNAALNFRIGFFLLRDRWDLAATLSEQISGNIDAEGTILTSAGLMSKVYFPIKKIHISPYVGGQAAVSIPDGGKASFTPSGLGGISWYIGIGSLDVGVSVGNSTVLMVGYTIIPNYRFSK
jgi:hypothetical protein